MAAGAMKSHARKVLRIYAARRDALAEALMRAFGEGLSFAMPQGGLALWVRFVGMDMERLAAAGRRELVGVTPGQAFATNGLKVAGARLGFGSLDEPEIVEAVKRLRRAALVAVS
jgi:GntR family transcriptional regulator/MocR family aminotransferase